MNFSTLIFTLLAFFTSLCFGAPILEKRDVFVPPVLLPDSNTVWKIGTDQTVVWDVTNPPSQITNPIGKIVLVTDGLLDFEHPLAAGFDIMLGNYTVFVPDVAPGSNYQIVVFGDSGNSGPKFTITN